MKDEKAMQNTVLIADDEPEVRNVVRRVLSRHGYDPVVASDGREALSMARVRKPGLILLDVNMPGLDGFAVCKELREEPSTRLIPILMLTARMSTDDKVTGLGLGADDYLTKPFDMPELLARIDTLLRRNHRMVSANPLTRLPGGPAIQEEIESRIGSGEKFGAAYIDIDNFKAYKDAYGYHQGDEVIKWTSRIIQEEASQGGSKRFLGHIGGDDFILVADAASMKDLCGRIADRFDREIKAWYNWSDNFRGYVQAKDRRGGLRKFPLARLSIAVSTNEKRPLTHYAQVAQITSELKGFVKGRAEKNKSAVAFDRRTY